MKLNFSRKCIKQATTRFILAFSLFLPFVSFASESFASEIISISALPPDVVSTINEKYPGASYLKAERETPNGDVIDYEVTICHEGKQYEIELTPAGVILDIDVEGQCSN